MDSEEEGEELNRTVQGTQLDEKGTVKDSEEGTVDVHGGKDRHAVESAVLCESDGDVEDCHGDVIRSKRVNTGGDNYGRGRDRGSGKDVMGDIGGTIKERSQSYVGDKSERKTIEWCREKEKEKEKGRYRDKDKEQYKPTKILSRDAIMHMVR